MCKFMQNPPNIQIINFHTSVKCLDSAEYLTPSMQLHTPTVTRICFQCHTVPAHIMSEWKGVSYTQSQILTLKLFCYIILFLCEIIGWAEVTSRILAAVTHQSQDETGLYESKCTQQIALQLRSRSMTYHKFQISALPIHSCKTD